MIGVVTALVMAAIGGLVEHFRELEAQGRARVADGDTIEIDGSRIRLHGVDAPELHQRCSRDGVSFDCGREVAERLRAFIADRELRCVGRNRDRYGRIVGVCTADGIDVNGWLVAQGLARAYLAHSRAYAGEEQRARAARLGLWSAEWEAPWDWRARHGS